MDTNDVKVLGNDKVVIKDGLLDLDLMILVKISRQVSWKLSNPFHFYMNEDDYQKLLDMVQEEGNE